MKFSLHLRVPGWCDHWHVRLNQSPISDLQSPTNGYLAITREWKSGDVVEFGMDMPIQTVWAHPAVWQMQGRFALQRGPLVYCLEGVNHDVINLDRIELNPSEASSFQVEQRADLLGGVTVLRGRGQVIEEAGWNDTLYRHNQAPARKPIDVMAVPYYAWDNRAPGEMRVWIRAG